MRATVHAFGLLVIGVALAGCQSEKQWMKVGEPYTTEEFRRDYRECSKRGRLDDDCMRGRGWVDMSPSKGDRAADAPPPPPPSPKPSRAPTGR